jgi:hypothetical protein
MNIVKNIVHRATKKPYLNILVLPYDGEYEKILVENLPHYLYTHPTLSIKEWKNPTDSSKIIYIKADKHNVSISENICLDCIITHNRTTQYEIAEKISSLYQIPIILVEHEKPPTKWIREQLKNRCSNIVYSNEEVAKSWGEFTTIIEYPTNDMIDFTNKWNELINKATK